MPAVTSWVGRLVTIRRMPRASRGWRTHRSPAAKTSCPSLSRSVRLRTSAGPGAGPSSSYSRSISKKGETWCSFANRTCPIGRSTPVDHVGVMLVPRRVGDVEHLGLERPVGTEAPVGRKGVEAPAPRPEARAQEDPAARTEAELPGDEAAHRLGERVSRIAEEVLTPDLRRRPPPDAEQPRHGSRLVEAIEVEQDHRDRLGERVARGCPAVPHGALVDGVGDCAGVTGRPRSHGRLVGRSPRRPRGSRSPTMRRSTRSRRAR